MKKLMANLSVGAVCNRVLSNVRASKARLPECESFGRRGFQPRLEQRARLQSAPTVNSTVGCARLSATWFGVHAYKARLR